MERLEVKKNQVFSSPFGSIVNRGLRSDPSGQGRESLGSHATTSLLQRGQSTHHVCVLPVFNGALFADQTKRGRAVLAADDSADGVKFKQETDPKPGEGDAACYMHRGAVSDGPPCLPVSCIPGYASGPTIVPCQACLAA